MAMAFQRGWCIKAVKDGQVIAGHKLHPLFCGYCGAQFCQSCDRQCPACGYWVTSNHKEARCVEE